MGKSSRRNRGDAKPSEASLSSPDDSMQSPTGNNEPVTGTKALPFLANIGSGIVQFGLTWAVVGVIVKFLSNMGDGPVQPQNNGDLLANVTANVTINSSAALTVMPKNAAPIQVEDYWGYDGDLWNISSRERIEFRPVISFPRKSVIDAKGKIIEIPVYQVMDLTRGTEGVILHNTWDDITDVHHNKSVDEQNCECGRLKNILKKCRHNPPLACISDKRAPYSVGRYNENRQIYTTSLFQNESYTLDGYDGARTVHIGIDLYAPVNSRVHSFHDAVVYAAGYNSDPGDYGHVIVLEHEVGWPRQKIWALYGHLSRDSVKAMKVGKKIRGGQVIGKVGSEKDNGGWSQPHVHFQMSINQPKTHDMPGAVSLSDRSRALIDYPDPRTVLGPLY